MRGWGHSLFVFDALEGRRRVDNHGWWRRGYNFIRPIFHLFDVLAMPVFLPFFPQLILQKLFLLLHLAVLTAFFPFFQMEHPLGLLLNLHLHVLLIGAFVGASGLLTLRLGGRLEQFDEF